MTALEMLREAHAKIKEGKLCDDKTAFEMMLQFIAYKIGYEPGIASPSLPLDLFNEVNTIFNDDKLAEDGWDWLGELAWELDLILGGNKMYATSRNVIEKHADPLIQHFANLEDQKPHRFLDILCGSGRMTLVLYNALYDDLIYYAAEPDLTLYRMMLLNCKIHDVPAIILNADYRLHELIPESENWKYAGLWNPISMNKLVAAPPQIDPVEVIEPDAQ